MKKATLVIGVIGADCHAVGNKVLDRVFSNHGFRVINLGVMVSQTNILMLPLKLALTRLSSSIYGHGDIDCLGMRERCIERGLGDILLYVGGNLVVGKHDFADVETKFKEMGFDRVFAPSHDLEDVCQLMAHDINQRHDVDTRILEEAI